MNDSLVFSKIDENNYLYNRKSSTELNTVKKLLITNYKYYNYCNITPSGMNAISLTLYNLIMYNIMHKINIIFSSELYCDTPRLITNLKMDFCDNVNTIKMDVLNYHSFISENMVNLQGRVNILIVESCSNPSGYVIDYKSINNKLREISKSSYVIVDNTWLTSFSYIPKDCDFVITSLTKYYSSGQCIAGAILSNNEKIMECIDKYIRVHGLHVSPYHCKLIIDNWKNIENNIKRSSHLTLKVAEYLNNKGVDVCYIGLPNHPSYKSGREFKYLPSVLTFTINKSKEQAIMWMKSNRHIKFKTSFGSEDTKFDPWPKEISKSKTNPTTMCRLAIGFDDNYDSIIDNLHL
jgi:cystathionine beta-lyase/cystathionine gamma-synthase